MTAIHYLTTPREGYRIEREGVSVKAFAPTGDVVRNVVCQTVDEANREYWRIWEELYARGELRA